MSTVLEQILEQAESLSRDDIRRLVKHLEWLAERPEPLNRVGHRLEDVLGFREEILALAQEHGVGNVRVFGSVARGDDDLDFLVDVCGETKAWLSACLMALLHKSSGFMQQRHFLSQMRSAEEYFDTSVLKCGVGEDLADVEQMIPEFKVELKWILREKGAAVILATMPNYEGAVTFYGSQGTCSHVHKPQISSQSGSARVQNGAW